MLTVSELAGLLAAKQTPHLIPLCHPLLLDRVTVQLQLRPEQCAVLATATVLCTGQAGGDIT